MDMCSYLSVKSPVLKACSLNAGINELIVLCCLDGPVAIETEGDKDEEEDEVTGMCGS